MKEFLILVIGIVIGGTFMTMLMCCLQINRLNDYERKCMCLENKLGEKYNENTKYKKTVLDK